MQVVIIILFLVCFQFSFNFSYSQENQSHCSELYGCQDENAPGFEYNEKDKKKLKVDQDLQGIELLCIQKSGSGDSSIQWGLKVIGISFLPNFKVIVYDMFGERVKKGKYHRYEKHKTSTGTYSKDLRVIDINFEFYSHILKKKIKSGYDINRKNFQIESLTVYKCEIYDDYSHFGYLEEDSFYDINKRKISESIEQSQWVETQMKDAINLLNKKNSKKISYWFDMQTKLKEYRVEQMIKFEKSQQKF
ncbi:MAG: hypothetical protein CMN00_04050 [Rickettsiales bacterium]|nr:hypothetical protein [Rickettsiales bacterium]